MENVITVNSTKESDISFDLTIEGTPASEAKVKFIIKTNKMELGFNCTKDSNNKWSVKLPALNDILETTAYNYVICLYADGYYFEPATGTINIEKSPEVYITKVKAGKLTSDTKKDIEPEEKTVDSLKPNEGNADSAKVKVKTESVKRHKSEMTIAELAESILNQSKPAKPVTNPTSIQPTEADQKVKNILKGIL